MTMLHRSHPSRSLLLAALVGAGCQTQTSAPRHLDPRFQWYGDNRERIDAWLDGVEAPGEGRPVAIFDWDNTVIKNDVGDITMFWLLRHDEIVQPPDRDWSRTSRLLTDAARTALDAACGALAEPGETLPTSTPEGLACADEILAIYTGAATRAGEPAFAGWNHRTMEPSYAWTVQLQAGHTPAEIRALADDAIAEALSAELGATQTVGSTEVNAYLRIYEPIADLLATLEADGLDVWVLSASSQPVVEAFAARVEVPAERVIGVRAVIDGAGVLTYGFQGCGSVGDGDDTLITYIEGKRCWMNQVIFGIEGPDAEAVQADPARRPVFAAGDSDTDVAFMQDATGLKLAINRNKSELMCNAYHDVGGNWLVNPMFIAPKDAYADGYACSADACVRPDGSGGPCTDERGAAIPDQQDTVYCRGGVYCDP